MVENVASIIKQQIGMAPLMMVGAHKFQGTDDSLIFTAKLIDAPRSLRPRLMQVTIKLEPSDTYSLKVGYFDRKKGWIRHYEREDVYCDELAGAIMHLDSMEDPNRDE